MPEAPDAVEIRVVACLVEKQRTTPDVYPLSLNSLRIACNQSTNRDPVVDYDEATVVEGLRRLALRGWTRLASGPGGRARKYRHLLDEALGVDAAEVSLLAVLMLRGAQTPGELKQRSERLHSFAGLGEVQETLERLIEREQVARLPRRPGQKEERFEHLLGGEAEAPASTPPTPRSQLRCRSPATVSTASKPSWPSSESRSPRSARRSASKYTNRLSLAGAAHSDNSRVFLKDFS